MSDLTPLDTAEILAEATGGAVPPPTRPTPGATAPDSGEKWPRQGADNQWRDKSGRIFDPQKHRMGSDDVPEVSEGGYFTLIPEEFRASEIRAGNSQNVGFGEDSGASERVPLDFSGLSGDDTGRLTPEHVAAQTVALEESMALMVFGDEWTMLPEEKKALVGAWVETYKVTGVVKVPWWLEIAMVHAAFAGKRLGQPKTQARLQPLKARAAAWLARLRVGKGGGR